jgi:hypothetical protein
MRCSSRVRPCSTRRITAPSTIGPGADVIGGQVIPGLASQLRREVRQREAARAAAGRGHAHAGHAHRAPGQNMKPQRRLRPTISPMNTMFTCKPLSARCLSRAQAYHDRRASSKKDALPGESGLPSSCWRVVAQHHPSPWCQNLYHGLANALISERFERQNVALRRKRVTGARRARAGFPHCGERLFWAGVR